MFTKESKVQFARVKLTGSVRIYWTSVESTRGVDFHRVLGWNET